MNLIKLSDKDKHEIKPRGKGDGATKGARKGTKQGLLMKISPLRDIIHTGGGRRSDQHGHSVNCEHRITEFLLTRDIPQYRICLTFPIAQRPLNAKEFIKEFEKRLGKMINYSGCRKMEIQPRRMSAEFMLFIWTNDSLSEETVYEIWSDVLGIPVPPYGVHFAIVEAARWANAAKYFSKKILIRADRVVVGNKEYVVTETEADKEYLWITPKPGKEGTAVDEPYIDLEEAHNTISPVSKELYNDWLNYHGQFTKKINPDKIPESIKENIVISQTLDHKFIGMINSTRKNYFQGKREGYHVILNNENQFILNQ